MSPTGIAVPMNPIFFHLTIVHIPILFVPVGVLLLYLAIKKNNPTLKSVALGMFIASTIFVVPAYLSGERSEDDVKKIVSVDKHDIHEHEEVAEITLWLVVALGVLSIGQVFIDKFKREISHKLTIPLFIVGVICAAFLAKTAWEGGKIRHPEAHSQESA